jgi:hypothetical protein
VKRVLKLAGWTGLEPATFCVTGRRSNQLSYHPERARGANVELPQGKSRVDWRDDGSFFRSHLSCLKRCHAKSLIHFCSSVSLEPSSSEPLSSADPMKLNRLALLVFVSQVVLIGSQMWEFTYQAYNANTTIRMVLSVPVIIRMILELPMPVFFFYVWRRSKES